jgi:hypothetical protein
MSKYTGYKPQYNESVMKYKREKRDKLTLDLPLGTKDRWNEQAKKAGAKSLTRYITELIEREMHDNP